MGPQGFDSQSPEEVTGLNMKKSLLILILSVLVGCGGGSQQEQDTFQKNLKYLSFWDSGIRTENIHPTENILHTIRETSKISNVITIAVTGYNYEVTKSTIAAFNEAISNNRKVILIVWVVLFEDSRLVADYSARMDILKNTVINPFREHIIAFYVEDEPFLSSKSHSAIQQDINILIADLRAEYPEIPSIVSYSHVELDNKSIKTFPVKADWVVANLYYHQLRNPALVRYYLDQLVAQKGNDQQVVFMMDAFFVGSNSDCILNNTTNQTGSLSFNHALIDWANDNPNIPVIASFVFLYNNGVEPDGTVICGILSMPKVLAWVVSLNLN